MRRPQTYLSSGTPTWRPRALRRRALGLALVLWVAAGAAEADWRSGEHFGDVPAAKQTWFARWEHHHDSSEGRPIEHMQVGAGEFRTLVLGSLHGSETMAVALAGELALHLGRMPDHWDELNALVVRTPNPDGLAQRNSLNSRGVDLNRNFPLPEKLEAERDARAGSSAFSEIETRVVRQLLSSYRPHRVVHVKSTRNDVGWVLCNRRAQGAADYLKQFRNLRVGRLEEHQTPGSVESYVSDVLGLETITLAVPHQPDEAAVWRDYRSPLLAATAWVEPSWRPATKYARTDASPPQNARRQRDSLSLPSRGDEAGPPVDWRQRLREAQPFPAWRSSRGTDRPTAQRRPRN